MRSLVFHFQIPAGVTANVSLPNVSEKPTLIINGEALVPRGKVKGQVELGHRVVTMKIGAGKYSGKYSGKIIP